MLATGKKSSLISCYEALKAQSPWKRATGKFLMKV